MGGFEELRPELPPEVLRGIYTYGFEQPSEVQARALPQLLSRRDVVVQAQSGSGKTAAFLIAAACCAGKTVIMCHTRELAAQTLKVAQELLQFTAKETCGCIGGQGRDGRDALQRFHTSQVVVGTPGRIADILAKASPDSVGSVALLVLDEADELLSEASTLVAKVQDALRVLPGEAQIALFSATMPESVVALCQKFMRDPHMLLLQDHEVAVRAIQCRYVKCATDMDKLLVLDSQLSCSTHSGIIIYVNSRQRADWLFEQLSCRTLPVCVLHAGLERGPREKAMADFRSGEARIMVSTGLTSRGIDVQRVSTVIMFDLVTHLENFIHTVGRSGRFGRKGTGMILVSDRDMHVLQAIQDKYSLELQEC